MVKRDIEWYSYLQDFYEFVIYRKWDNPTSDEFVEEYLKQGCFTGDIKVLREHAASLSASLSNCPDFEALYPPDRDSNAILKERLIKKVAP